MISCPTTPQMAGGAVSSGGKAPLYFTASGTVILEFGAASTVKEASTRNLHRTAIDEMHADKTIEEWDDEEEL